MCLSDLHLIDGTLRLAPHGAVTLGHEVAGVVEKLGSAVPDSITLGQRVALQAGQSCGNCANCQLHKVPCLQPMTRGVHYDGGWAQYTTARIDTLVPDPGRPPVRPGGDHPGRGVHALRGDRDHRAVRVAQSAGVWGVGGLGAHGVQLLRMVGAAPIIAVDPLPAARERALAFGADLALDPTAPDFADQVRVATGGRGLDHAFDFAGVPAVREQADAVLAAGGSLVLIGLTPEPLTITNSIRFSTRQHRLFGPLRLDAAARRRTGRVGRARRLDLSQSISGHIPLAEAPEAVRQLAEKENNPIRLILHAT